jgi:hypothetical protein
MKFSAIATLATAGFAVAKPIMRRQEQEQEINIIMRRVLDALISMDEAIAAFEGTQEQGNAVQAASNNMYNVVVTAQGEVENVPIMTEEQGEAFLVVSDPLDAAGAQLHIDLDGKNSLFASLGMCASILDVITVVGDESIKLMWAVEAKFDSDSTHGQEKIQEFVDAFDKSEELLRQCATTTPEEEDTNIGSASFTGETEPTGETESTGETKPTGETESTGETKPTGETESTGETLPIDETLPTGETAPTGETETKEKPSTGTSFSA